MQCEGTEHWTPMLKEETNTCFYFEFKWRKLNVKAATLPEEPSPFKLHAIPTLLL